MNETMTIMQMNNVNHTNVIKDYLNNNATYVTEKYDISKTVLLDILKKHDIERHRNVKYCITKDDLIEDFKSGMSNIDIARKYKCSKDLIATRKYQMRKEGLI